jgi:hypothetical protein
MNGQSAYVELTAIAVGRSQTRERTRPTRTTRPLPLAAVRGSGMHPKLSFELVLHARPPHIESVNDL